MAKRKVHDSVVIPKATVYKKGNIQNLQGNSCRLYLSYKDGDHWRYKTRTYRTDGDRLTRTEAVEALIAWGQQLEAELLEAERRAEEEARNKKRVPTVNEYMRAYIDERATSIERRTVSGYESILKRHIAPTLGEYRIDELTPEIVAAWVTECAKTHAPRTVRKALVLLRSAMQQAVDRETLAKNPTRTVKPPKVPTTNPNALDERGRARVLQFIEIDPASAANVGFSLALVMGMRQGEVCGLKWRYVDLKAKTLDVVETLGRDDGKKGADHWYMKEPKTGGSRRTLSIPDQLVAPLKERLHVAKENAFKLGMDYRDFYVIGGEDGSFMNGDMLSARWHNVAKALELVGIQGTPPTFHDLRHTWATKAVGDGKDIKTVSSTLGHSNAAMTLNIYASADPAAKKETSQSVADSMFEEAHRNRGGSVVDFTKTGTEG